MLLTPIVLQAHKALPHLGMRPTLLYARVQCASEDVSNMGKRLR